MKFKNIAQLSTATLLTTLSLSNPAIAGGSDSSTENCINDSNTNDCGSCEEGDGGEEEVKWSRKTEPVNY